MWFFDLLAVIADIVIVGTAAACVLVIVFSGKDLPLDRD